MSHNFFYPLSTYDRFILIKICSHYSWESIYLRSHSRYRLLDSILVLVPFLDSIICFGCSSTCLLRLNIWSWLELLHSSVETRCYPKLQKNERLLNRNLSEQTLPINYENIAFKEHLGEMIDICPKAISRLIIICDPLDNRRYVWKISN